MVRFGGKYRYLLQQLRRLISCSMVVVIQLQFDGSLRSPRDPGFRKLPSRLATCAASIRLLVLDENDHADDTEQTLQGINKSIHSSKQERPFSLDEYNVTASYPVAIVSKRLPVIGDGISAHAEYEGLILGLEWLCQACSRTATGNTHFEDKMFEPSLVDFISKSMSQQNRHDDDCHRGSTRSIITSSWKLLIQGDCKTVIDQMSGRSYPRKLRSLQQQAKSLLTKSIFNLRQLFSSSSSKPTRQQKDDDGDDEIKKDNDYVFRLIPRLENCLCDNICNNYISLLISDQWTRCCRELYDCSKMVDSATTIYNKNNDESNKNRIKDRIDKEAKDGQNFNDVDRRNRRNRREKSPDITPSSSLSTLSSFIDRYLVDGTSWIRYSIRPALYTKLANMAYQLNDYDTLLRIGECLEAESRYWQSSTAASPTFGAASTTSSNPSTCSDSSINSTKLSSSSSESTEKGQQKQQQNEYLWMLWKHLAILYQMDALDGREQTKEVLKLERKHRSFLRRRRQQQQQQQQLIDQEIMDNRYRSLPVTTCTENDDDEDDHDENCNNLIGLSHEQLLDLNLDPLINEQSNHSRPKGSRQQKLPNRLPVWDDSISTDWDPLLKAWWSKACKYIVLDGDDGDIQSFPPSIYPCQDGNTFLPIDVITQEFSNTKKKQ